MTEGGSEDLFVGLEIHQQLSIGTKLFCACPPLKSEELPYHFERRLRPAQSETGRLDPAAVFEFSKGRSNMYYWSPESSCLVEADEEPPHPLSAQGLEAALLIAKTLGSNVVDEVHVMRKIVIDGSNTGGFQRTAVVGLGGGFKVDGTPVGVQTVTLEEDAARILGEDPRSRRFALDRLGVALVEVALEPVRGDPEFVGRVALHLGRVLRSTGRVARGLGTIRQDLNVSLRGRKVVEVKGVQKLNLLPRVVEYEKRRQLALVRLSRKLRERGVTAVSCTVKDATPLLAGTGSRAIGQQLGAGGKAACIGAKGLGGLIGWEPLPGVRLGKELAEVARANSLGGVIHSDEFERQGITAAEASALMQATGSGPEDALVVLAGPGGTVDRVVPLLVARLEEAPAGVPAETRAATDEGETRYMRPRPGSQRMYPETDIPNIVVSHDLLLKTSRAIPRDWREAVAGLEERYSLSRDLALKVYDSDLGEEFAGLVRALRVEPSFIASVIVDLPTRMERDGVPEEAVSLPVLKEVLGAVGAGLVAKEAVPDILRKVGEKGGSVDGAIDSLGLKGAGEPQVRRVVASVVEARESLIRERGEGAFSALMGEVMKELRGRADGALVSRVLKEALADATREGRGGA